jgi:hypothetical protein
LLPGARGIASLSEQPPQHEQQGQGDDERANLDSGLLSDWLEKQYTRPYGGKRGLFATHPARFTRLHNEEGS